MTSKNNTELVKTQTDKSSQRSGTILKEQKNGDLNSFNFHFGNKNSKATDKLDLEFKPQKKPVVKFEKTISSPSSKSLALGIMDLEKDLNSDNTKLFTEFETPMEKLVGKKLYEKANALAEKPSNETHLESKASCSDLMINPLKLGDTQISPRNPK